MGRAPAGRDAARQLGWSRRCQASSVPGVTSREPRSAPGSIRASTAMTVRGPTTESTTSGLQFPESASDLQRRISGPAGPVPDVAGLRVHPRYMAGMPEVQLATFLPRSWCCLSRAAGTSGDYGSCSSLKPLPCRHSGPPGALFPATVTASPRIGLDLAVTVLAPCLLGCQGTARQRPVPGGSGSRGLPHGPAGSGITRHQEVLSNTLSSS